MTRPGAPLQTLVGRASRYAQGTGSPVQTLQDHLARIKLSNPRINAVLELRVDAALAEAEASARRWRAGAPWSAIDGAVIGVKANIAVAGLAHHGGVGAYRDVVAAVDATCVARLKAAGAIVIGTLNMHEGALGATTDNPFFGRCRNPWDERLTPGGSSGGSGAAVAAGFCDAALGTDTMGSVRIPSAYCGIAAHKPTNGSVDEAGLMALSPTLDVIGVHAVSAADAALLHAVIADKPTPDEPAGLLRIGVARWGDRVVVEPPVLLAFQAAERLAARIAECVDVDLADFDFGALRRKGLLISEREGCVAHRAMLAMRPEGFSEDFRGMLAWGARQPQEKVDQAYADVRAAGASFATRLASVDALLIPATPQGPFPFEAAAPANQADFTCLANFAGAPATVVPASAEGAPPFGIQFVSAPGRDASSLRIARAYERARGPSPSPSSC